METFFCNAYGSKRLKAVDTIVFVFLFPFSFMKSFHKVKYENQMNVILRLMVEFNFYLLLFFCKNVPIEDIKKHWKNFIALMIQIENMSDDYKFLKECFYLFVIFYNITFYWIW